jgi:hypothetical protein
VPIFAVDDVNPSTPPGVKLPTSRGVTAMTAHHDRNDDAAEEADGASGRRCATL